MIPIHESYQLYQDYNRRFFGAKLPNIKIEYSANLKRAAGMYSPKDKLIYLSIPLLSKLLQDLKDTLVHEMIHVAQDYQGDKGRPHGLFFSILMHRINEQAKGEVFVTVRHHFFEIREYEESSVLGKIKKLLVLSDSPNQNEAYAAANKAQALMSIHGIKQTDLATVEEGSELDEPLVNEVIEPCTRVTAWQFSLLAAIAEVNYSLCLSTSQIGLRVLGNKMHVEVTRSYYQYFCRLIESEAIQFKGKGSVFLNRFKESMAQEIGDRLKAQFRTSSKPIKPESSALCLASQYKAELERFVNFLCPNIGSKQGSARRANPEASQAGRQAGARASVAKHIVSGAKMLGGSR
jgi:predicted SprT family Zn-dependent metalloprotease